ncbi:hypothetical protein MARHY3684 [Marinobacter nauticus ATCC 49840]|nr:hypothetical protein MARHY3684 [Marinobacter nauticus ATCC 49840]
MLPLHHDQGGDRNKGPDVQMVDQLPLEPENSQGRVGCQGIWRGKKIHSLLPLFITGMFPFVIDGSSLARSVMGESKNHGSTLFVKTMPETPVIQNIHSCHEFCSVGRLQPVGYTRRTLQGRKE